MAISKKWSDFQLIDESELSAPKKEVSEYAEEKLSKINSLDIEDVIPSLFEYLRTQIKCKHPFTFSEGFIYENGVLLTQVRIDEERNKLHDFSNELFDFS